MKIKRTSWHYKLSLLGDYEKRYDNLCNYFWRLVFKVGSLFVLAVTLSFLVFAMITNSDIRWTFLFIFYIVANAFLPVFAISCLRERMGKSPEVPGENIVKEFIKAKKNKLCPMIKYVN